MIKVRYRALARVNVCKKFSRSQSRDYEFKCFLLSDVDINVFAVHVFSVMFADMNENRVTCQCEVFLEQLKCLVSIKRFVPEF